MNVLRPHNTIIGSHKQMAPHSGGRAARRRVAARVRPVTKIADAKCSGVGQTSDLGKGINLGTFFRGRRGPQRPSHAGSSPRSPAAAARSAISLLASRATAMARCCR